MPNTLYEYYTQQGQKLPSISERAKTYQDLGLGNAADYKGTILQNAALLNRMGSAPVPQKETPTVKERPDSIIAKSRLEIPDFSLTSEEKQRRDLYESDYRSATKTQAQKDEEDQAMRAAARARLQGLIDTISLAATDQIAKFRNSTAKSREGQSYALAAAGGRIGSATGEAEFRNVEDVNNQEEKTYRDEANAKIAALMGQADRDATAEIQARRASIQQGADKFLEYLSSVSERKQTQVSSIIKNMVANGIDPLSLSDSDFEKLQTQYGVSKDTLISLFNDAKITDAKAKAEAIKDNTFELSEGQSRYVYDPVTGEAKLVASKAKTYAPKDGLGTGTGGSGNPAVDAWVSQIQAGSATIANVPAALKNAVVQALNSSAPADNSDYQIGVLKIALENVKKTKGAAGASGVGKFLGDAFIGNTQFRQLEAYIDTVKSNLLALATDPSIKKFFGPQMSNRDVELMTSIASSIDAQRLKPEQIQEEINKIESFIEKLQAAKQSAGAVGASTSAEYTSASGKTYKLPN